MTPWQTGTPAEPGDYVADRGPGQPLVVLHWSAESVDWRQGAVRQQVRRWIGPLPERVRAKRPEVRS